MAADVFTSRALGVLRFQRDGGGQITGFTVTDDRTRGIAFVRR